MSKRLILYAGSNFSAKIDHVASIDKVIGIFFLGGGGGPLSCWLPASSAMTGLTFGVP